MVVYDPLDPGQKVEQMGKLIIFLLLLLFTTTAATTYNLTAILGYHHHISATITVAMPTTMFIPPSPLLLPLLQHSVTGLYPFRRLTTLTSGTDFQTLASTALCLTLTKSPPPLVSTLFVAGAEITRPDLFNDGNLIIHGIKGRLSPSSCQIQRTTSLSFPPSTAMDDAITDVVLQLRDLGSFNFAAGLIEVNRDLLMSLNKATILIIDDAGVERYGRMLESSFKLHIVPNQLIEGMELSNLADGTKVETMKQGFWLHVMKDKGGGLRIMMNGVPITIPNLVSGDGRLVVHVIAASIPPLP